MLDVVCRSLSRGAGRSRCALRAGPALRAERGDFPRPATHTSVCRSLAPDDDRRVLALWRLAQVYEARQLLVSARDSYLEMAGAVSQDETWRTRTEAHRRLVLLAGPSWRGRFMRRSSPSVRSRRLRLPLFRRWHWQPPHGEPAQTLVAEGIAPSLDCGPGVPGREDGAAAAGPGDRRDAMVGRSGAPAVWAGYLSDKLIVATPRQIAALELSQGTVQWRFDVKQAGKDADRPDPFANAAEPSSERPAAGLSFVGFPAREGPGLLPAQP